MSEPSNIQEPPNGGSDQRLVRDWSAHNYGTHWLINNSFDNQHVEAWGVSEKQAHAIRDTLIANASGMGREDETPPHADS